MDKYSYGVITENDEIAMRLNSKEVQKKYIACRHAVTLHNYQRNWLLGWAFGGVAAGIPSATIGAAISLALGIGLQNFPEGAAVSLPLRREGLSRTKSFFYGQASGIVEPIAGFLGAMAAVGD